MASTAQSPLRERPIQFGKYTLLARISAGGMGELYLAKLQSAGGFEKLVVIKRILSHLTDKQEFVDMFVAEARTAARIAHPNVCQIYELGQVDGRYYMALEYLEGLPLADVMVARKRAPQLADLRLLCSLVAQTAEGLHHAHSMRESDEADSPHVVHRDVNPRNIFVTSAGVAKVLDFGIVKVRGALSQIQTDSVKGTYSYMAPEQLQGETVDCTADIFALGTITWEAVVGRRLFKRSSDLLTWRAIVEEPIPRPTQFRPDLPAELDEAIMRALCRPPAERYQSAREFATAVEQAIHDLGAPLTTLAVAEEMEKAFATELAGQRERVFAAHRRQDAEPAVSEAELGAAPTVPRPQDAAPIDDWYGGGSETQVADPGYAELVAKMAQGRSEKMAAAAEPLRLEPPTEGQENKPEPRLEESELFEIVEEPVVDLPIVVERPLATKPIMLPRPSRLPSPPPPPSYVVEEAAFAPEAPAAPVAAAAEDEEDDEQFRIRPRRRWVVVLALLLSAATGAALVLLMKPKEGEQEAASATAPERAVSVVAGDPAPGAAAKEAVDPASATAESVTEAGVAGSLSIPAPSLAPPPPAEAEAPEAQAPQAPAPAPAPVTATPAPAGDPAPAPAGDATAPPASERKSADLERAAERDREKDLARDRSRERRERREARRERRAEKAAAEREAEKQREARQREARQREARQREAAAAARDPVKDRERLAQAPAPAASGKDGGFLTINAEPYATVYVDGKKRGFTPVVRMTLAPGAHRLRLVSSAGQPDKKMRVKIVAGQELRKFVRW